MGLRSDVAWVQEVAGLEPERDDATAFEHPLSDDEVDALFARQDNELLAELKRYSAGHPDTFSETLINHRRGGRTEIAFTRDLDRHRAALADRLGSKVEKVDVIAGVLTRAETNALLERVSTDLRDRGRDFLLSSDPVTGRIEVTLDVVREQDRAHLATAYRGIAICVSGPTPDELVPEGPQPSGGEGWRFLATGNLAGGPDGVNVARREGSYRDLWARLGLRGDPPALDFDVYVVVQFTVTNGQSCPELRLDGITFGDPPGVVRTRIVRPGPRRPVCTLDARPRAFVVALERARLPDGPFELRTTSGPSVQIDLATGRVRRLPAEEGGH